MNKQAFCVLSEVLPERKLLLSFILRANYHALQHYLLLLYMKRKNESERYG